MTYKKAKKEIDTRIKLARKYDLAPDYIETLEVASEALKRQMPKKPTTESTRYGLVYDCSVCNCGLEPHDGYCSRCGQAIDWSEE